MVVTDRIVKPPFYAFAGGLAMGCGVMAGWAEGVFPGLAPLAVAARDAAGWGAPGLAATAGACAGVLLGRWAEAYADRLDAGAPATARTLWTAAASAPSRPWRPVRDTATAALLGLAAGLLAAGGGLGRVPLVLTLAALAWIDARSGLLPDALTLPLMAAGWLLGALDPASAAGASALTWAGLAGAAWLYRRVRGRDGFGGGDVKCLAALAGWFGLEAAAGILWLACVLGLLGCLVWRGGWRRPYPFGPCIALAAGAWMPGCP
jgi:leader peptidase (prepilin peptidase)/N-methyltransferase